MYKPYSKVLDREWAKTQNFSAVVWGDAVYEIVQLGAKRLEDSWKIATEPWERILHKSVETGFLGFGQNLVNPKALEQALFSREKHWPVGLTEKEKIILRLAKEVSAYHPSPDYTLSEILGLRSDPKAQRVSPESPELILKALKNFAGTFNLKVAHRMWKSYSDTSKHVAPKIMRACEQVYGESCGLEESRGMFYGDMDRGWKAETLKISNVTYRVYGVFLEYLELEASK